MGRRTRSVYLGQPGNSSILVVGPSVKASVPLLAGCGFDANLCPNGIDALEMLNERRYHAVLCGLDLPGEKGMSFLNLVCDEFPEVAVVIVTKPGELHRAMMAMIAGASGYIQTPLRPAAVSSSLKSALKKKWLESALLGLSDSQPRTPVLDSVA